MASEILKLDMSYEKLMAQSMKDLADTPLNHTSPGSVTKLILSKVNTTLGSFYEQLEISMVQVLLSKAEGPNIDLLGQLLQCTRYTGESDSNYKYRVANQALTLERANETAVRLAALSVPEVKDVILKEYTQGTGSFSVYPIIDNPKMMTSDLLNRVSSAVNSVKSLGTRATVLSPRLATVEVRARILFDERTPQANRGITISQATDYLRRTIANCKPGDIIYPDDMRKEIIRLDESIMNVTFYHFTINDRPMVVTDQPSAWNEQFVEADTPQAILVS